MVMMEMARPSTATAPATSRLPVRPTGRFSRLRMRVSWSFRVVPCWSSTTSNLVSSRVSQRRTSSSLTARRLGASSVALVAQGFGQDLQRRHLGGQFSDALSLTPDHGVLVDLREVAHGFSSGGKYGASTRFVPHSWGYRAYPKVTSLNHPST